MPRLTPPPPDGRYRAIDLITSGRGMQVWRGRDDRLHRDVRLRQPGAVEHGAAFLQAAGLMARLDHPGVLTVFDIATEPTVVVTEHVDGITLTRRLADRGAFSPPDAVRLLDRVADAVATLHRAGLSHGSLTTDSIELTDDGRVVITDLQPAPVTSDDEWQADIDALHDVLAAAVGEHPGGELLDFVHRAGPSAPPAGIDADGWRHRLTQVSLDAAPPSLPTADDDASFRSEMAWLAPAVGVVVVALILMGVGLFLGRTSTGRDIIDTARDAVGLERSATTTVPEAASPADGGPTNDAFPTPAGVPGLTSDLAELGDLDGEVVPIAAIFDYDPLGDDQVENPGRLNFINDGDPTTFWRTSRYNTADFGRLKRGVGLVVRLPLPTSVDRIDVGSPNQGWSVEIYAADGVPEGGLDGWGVARATATDIAGNASLAVGGDPVSTVLIWITDLGPLNDEGQHRVRIGEVTVRSRGGA